MIGFLINLYTLVKSLMLGLKNDGEFRALAILLAALLALGTVFYSRMEHWSLVDSLYFCVMTIATIGYGDLAPSTPLSKLFTVGYAFLGIGLFASFVGKLVMLRIKENR